MYGYEGGVLEGVVERGINGDGPSDTLVATVGIFFPEDLLGQGGARGGGVVYDVFPLKREGGYWGIGLVKVVWKVCLTVVNCWLKRIGMLHYALHRFRAVIGTGTATLEAKLAQKLAGIAHEPLFQIFLDVRKAYDSLYRCRCMEILRVYGMGQRMARLIAHHWDNFMFVPKENRFLGKPFVTGRGVTQGPRFPHNIQYCGGRGGEGNVRGSLRPPGGAAWDGLGGGRAQTDILRGRQ